MKSLNLLYLYLGKAETLILKVFSAYYSISIHEVTQDGHWERKKWNLVIFQDAIHNKVHKKHFSELLKYPWLLISVSSDIQGYMAPHPNLFGVINLSHIDLTLWGIPQELVTKLQYPAPKIADYYFYEPHPEICRIVYCPTGNNILENDFKLISFVQKTNAELIIVSDRYGAVANAFPPFVHVVSEKSWLSVFKKAHLVVASKQNAVCALALCKPCVVMGDCGLGGMVSIRNYEQLQSVFFRGRKGASPGEIVPGELLEIEICKRASAL